MWNNIFAYPSIYQNQPERNIIHLANYPYCPKRQNGLQSCTRCQLNFNYLVTRQSNINSFKQSALVYLDLYVLIRSYIERTAEDEWKKKTHSPLDIMNQQGVCRRFNKLIYIQVLRFFFLFFYKVSYWQYYIWTWHRVWKAVKEFSSLQKNICREYNFPDVLRLLKIYSQHKHINISNRKDTDGSHRMLGVYYYKGFWAQN